MKKTLKTILLTTVILTSCSDSDDSPIVEEKPTIESTTTEETVQITFTSMKISGKVTPEGNQQINARGVCWSESTNPTIDDNKTEESSNIFTSDIQELTENTTYHFRIYATTSESTYYSEEFTYSTSVFAGTTWDFHLIYSEDTSWHADVIFNEDGTTVYDEPECPGCYTSYGIWELNGNELYYEMDEGMTNAYVFTGTISENTMSGTWNFGAETKQWTAEIIE